MILCLETSTKNCSVAIIHQGEILANISEAADQYIHSEKLHTFIQQALKTAGLKPKDLQAVAVGKGPGSYTGLRIGVSAAKGFCYSLDIPLLSVDGLEILVRSFINEAEVGVSDLIIPMIDARRMEVYYAVHNANAGRVEEIKAEVIGEDFPQKWVSKNLHFIGDGAQKLEELFKSNDSVNIHHMPYPEAAQLGILAEGKLKANMVEDMAYFEPFYLKNFKAIKPKNPFAL